MRCSGITTGRLILIECEGGCQHRHRRQRFSVHETPVLSLPLLTKPGRYKPVNSTRKKAEMPGGFWSRCSTAGVNFCVRDRNECHCAGRPKRPCHHAKPKNGRNKTSAGPLQNLGVQVRDDDFESDEVPSRPRFESARSSFDLPAHACLPHRVARVETTLTSGRKQILREFLGSCDISGHPGCSLRRHSRRSMRVICRVSNAGACLAPVVQALFNGNSARPHTPVDRSLTRHRSTEGRC